MSLSTGASGDEAVDPTDKEMNVWLIFSFILGTTMDNYYYNVWISQISRIKLFSLFYICLITTDYSSWKRP